MGLGHGTQPLFDHVPVFTHRPTAESLAAAGDTTDMKVAQAVHARAVVRPALAAGRSVFMDGWSWDDPAQPELADGLSPHVVGVFSGEPTQTSPVAIETYRRRIATSRTQAIELSGHRGDATEGLFLALIRAGLFMSKPEDAHP
jgi:hypothetical protein